MVDYVHKINQRGYDLKLDENSEEELSLLTNELYKTTVLLQEAAEAERKRTKNLETALADISHQLRTPLTSLHITLDNLSDHPELGPETRQDFLRLAGRQVEQMSGLVVTLLNLAKLDNGTLKMNPKIVTVSDVMDKVTENLSVLAEINNVEIKVSGDLSAKLKIDPKWQVEALANIVKNCIEHSGEGQTVEIAVERTAIFTRIIVSDSGEGISPEDLRHVFERFYQTKNAREGSFGIGLSLSKKLIESDGGQVKVKSRNKVGTKYIVTYFK